MINRCEMICKLIDSRRKNRNLKVGQKVKITGQKEWCLYGQTYIGKKGILVGFSEEDQRPAVIELRDEALLLDNFDVVLV